MDWPSIIGNAVRGMFGPEAAIFALSAIGLNIHFGYTGLLNFGQVGFMLVGAYGVAVSVATFGWSMWVGVLVGIACAVVLALILGLPTLRLRGDYLAIATIAAAEVLRYFYRSSTLEPLTGGVYGLRQFADEFFAINPWADGTYGFGRVTFDHRSMWVMTVTWGLVALGCIMVKLLISSPWGRVLRSVREDELAARSLGKSAYSFKLQSLVLGGAIGGLAGVLMAISAQSVQPDSYDPKVTFYLYTIVILGGASRVMGPVLGSILFWFIVTFFDAFLRSATASGLIPSSILDSGDVGAARFLLVGLGLVLLMVYRPAGILGDQKELRLDVR
ncbi:branched-chain amino acid ABC transporter permease [Janibacter cremeus]|uniref:Branched-chain amino acid transport system permease protein n=1 Tax=Janibacter cremeus TaxID=1285192 RepID=A0A852VHY3_9MICO|nr:branched-chain amino acid ABC transporter permease [Janibacter cremeus]NYF96692.1 branched-chain amino acid transport system permease protein [Janibacter cremeus]